MPIEIIYFILGFCSGAFLVSLFIVFYLYRQL